MSRDKQKLELTWIGKESHSKLEPRILLESTEMSYHAEYKVSDDDIFENKLIFGDNLLALKALEQEHAGKIKCVFIDPPYNTGSAFEHYDDGIEHSLWLTLMRDRLEMIHRLLAQDGSIWITIDDNEAHYLKILCDEIFGRMNFIANVIWQKKFSPQNDAKWLSNNHDHILCFAKNKADWKPNPLPRSEATDKRYKNPDKDPRGPWASTDLTRSEHRDRDYWGMITPSGREAFPAKGRSWSRPAENIEKLKSEGRLWFGPNGDRMPRLKKYLTEMTGGITPQTIWLHGDVGNTQEAKKEVLKVDAELVFDTPKPERLIYRVLHIASSPGDIVLDSFLGSGTTAAVAHKMGRRWIGIELGEHCHTHCIPRLKKIVDGEDSGGTTEVAEWKGGGGFRYYRLAPSLIKEDQWGNHVINSDFVPELVAEAVCKIEGFKYAPSEEHYWQHGQASETDYIYVTTQILSRPKLEELSQAVGSRRSLLVCCGAFRIKPDAFSNLTLKKIPKAVLSRCEWDHDDYSLRIQNLPPAPKLEGQQDLPLV